MPVKTRLTLKIDPEVVRAAKTLAHSRGTTLSAVVEEHLRELRTETLTGTPVVSALRGILNHDGDVEDYHHHLGEKHAT